MQAYLIAFVNWKQNNWVGLLLRAKFNYSNTKNTSTSDILFELNYRFYPQVLLKENIKSYFRSRLANKLADKIKKLI